MKELIINKTERQDAHHDYIYKDGKKIAKEKDNYVFCYLTKSGMLKATEHEDIAGSIEGRYVKTDELSSEKGTPCINGKTYDIWGIGENYVLISNKGDKFYISSKADGSKVDHPNQRGDYFAYTLLHEIYTMLK
nr:MAG TPA: hypothetical protein [Caudoviricetes sp.]